MAIITVSRGTFTGGKELAEHVARRLRYRCLSREEVIRKASQWYSASENELLSALDSKPGFFERVSLRRIHYVAFVRAALAHEIRQDNVVYHGQVGHLLLKGLPNVFSLRVIAYMEFRIKAAMAQYHLNREQAESFIEKADKNRVKWTKALYCVDWEDPSLYDLVIDLTTMSIAEAGDRVINAVQVSPQVTADSRKALKDLRLATEVRARIAAHRAIEDVEIEVEADDEVITVKGVVESDAEASWIREVVNQTPGVRDMIPEFKIRTSGVYSSR